MVNNGLKLIAIKVLDNCDPKFLRILIPNKIYYFYNDYKFERNVDGEETVIVNRRPASRIFDVPGLKVNVSAIVGKNGSGKSSLVELLYVLFYNISKQQRLLDKKDELGEIYRLEPGIAAAIYFEIDGAIFKLEQNNNQTHLYTFRDSLVGFQSKEKIERKEQLESLFFSIVVNYSHYALNTSDVGHWVKAIFHKNDAYQTPIVINPFRDKGNIDINVENHLVKSRLLANILAYGLKSFSFDKTEKFVAAFHFAVDMKKFKINKRTNKVTFERTHNTKKYALPTIYEVFFGDRNFEPSESVLNEFAIEYILRKLHTIVVKYKHYFRFRRYMQSLDDKKLKPYLIALKKDQSHITFKLRQALNFLRSNSLPKAQRSFSVDVQTLSKAILDMKSDDALIARIPPSFLTIDIEFQGGDRFSTLSSGQKQKIYTISSLIYHLKNLESVIYNPKVEGEPFEKLLRYRHVNVIFDEIELYYHPDLQRRFVHDLITNLKHANFTALSSINFIFITHSPFILSDVPQQNAMFLDVDERKAIQRYPMNNTFAGNVHDLLANNFFLEEDGYMGEFAKSLISELYNYLTRELNGVAEPKVPGSFLWSKELAEEIIATVGEPMLRASLRDLYVRAFFKTAPEIDQEIARLQDLKKSKSV